MALFTARSGSRHIERLARENGWSIDERDGKMLSFHFRGDDIRPIRAVRVIHSDGDEIATFVAESPFTFTEDRVTSYMLGVLLARNDQSIVSWGGKLTSDDRFLFTCNYTALAAGLNAVMFRFICQKMVDEVAAIERRFREKGLI